MRVPTVEVSGTRVPVFLGPLPLLNREVWSGVVLTAYAMALAS